MNGNTRVKVIGMFPAHVVGIILTLEKLNNHESRKS